jgi:hypothetical protein
VGSDPYFQGSPALLKGHRPAKNLVPDRRTRCLKFRDLVAMPTILDLSPLGGTPPSASVIGNKLLPLSDRPRLGLDASTLRGCEFLAFRLEFHL